MWVRFDVDPIELTSVGTHPRACIASNHRTMPLPSLNDVHRSMIREDSMFWNPAVTSAFRDHAIPAALSAWPHILRMSGVGSRPPPLAVPVAAAACADCLGVALLAARPVTVPGPLPLAMLAQSPVGKTGVGANGGSVDKLGSKFSSAIPLKPSPPSSLAVVKARQFWSLTKSKFRAQSHAALVPTIVMVF